MAKARAKGQQHNQRARLGQVDQGRRPATETFVDDDEIDEIRRVGIEHIDNINTLRGEHLKGAFKPGSKLKIAVQSHLRLGNAQRLDPFGFCTLCWRQSLPGRKRCAHH